MRRKHLAIFGGLLLAGVVSGVSIRRSQNAQPVNFQRVSAPPRKEPQTQQANTATQPTVQLEPAQLFSGAGSGTGDWWFDFRRLRAAMEADGIDSTIDRIRTSAANSDGQRLAQTLDLSSHILRVDPNQLWFQVFARTRRKPETAIDRMLSDAAAPKLRPRVVSLPQSGGRLLRVVRGNFFGALDVDVSPDGSRFVIGTGFGHVRLYDLATAKLIWSVQPVKSPVDCVVFAPEQDWIAISGDEQTIKLLDASSGESVREIDHQDANAYTVAFSPDGRLLASGRQARSSDDDRAQRAFVWDAYDGSRLHALSGHRQKVFCVRFFPDGNSVLTAGYDKTVRKWDLETGLELQSVRAHDSTVSHAAISPDGSLFATATFDGPTIKLWNAKTFKPISEGRIGGGNTFLAFSRDGSQLASAGAGGQVTLSQVANLGAQMVVGTHTNVVNAVAFTPNGTRLVSASSDNTVRVWDTTLNAPEPTRWHGGRIGAVSFSPDGNSFASAGSNREVKIWDSETGVCHATLSVEAGRVTELCFAPNGKRLAAATTDAVYVWNTETLQQLHKLTPPVLERLQGVPGVSAVRSLAFSPDGSQLAAGTHSLIRLWDADTGEEYGDLTGHKNLVHSLVYHPDGSRLFSASSDGSICVWDQTHEQVQVLNDQRFIDGMTMANGGDLLLVCGGSTVRRYDLMNSKWLTGIELPGYARTIARIGEKTVVTADDDGNVCIWDAISGEELDCCNLDDRLSGIAASPTGRIVGGGAKGQLHVLDWNAD